MKMVHFTKMHGAGNDFVLIDDRDEKFPVHDHLRLAAFAAARTGIGCEGVILVQPSKIADFRMVFFNPDGTEADLCGNGARCVAAFAREVGAAKGCAMTFETRAGLVDAEVIDAGKVKVWMPEPKDRRYGLDVEGSKGDYIVAGVPHFVVPCENVAAVDVDALGRKLRLAAEFEPNGTNVDFAQFISLPLHVHTSQGFNLTIDGDWRCAKCTGFTLTGPVKKVFEGDLDLDSLDIGNEME